MPSFLDSMDSPAIQLTPVPSGYPRSPQSAIRNPQSAIDRPTTVQVCASLGHAAALLITGPLTKPQIQGLYTLLPESAVVQIGLSRRWKVTHVFATPEWSDSHRDQDIPTPVLTFALKP